MNEPWPAPTAAGPLDVVVRVPGSKSLTNRYLVLAALADGPCRLREALVARDTALMAAALFALGTGVEQDGDGWMLSPAARPSGDTDVDCGLAGTVMRFLPPVAALADGPVHFDGDEGARRRPMRPVLDALRTLGVTVDDEGRGGLPFTIQGAETVPGGLVELDASASSQFVSALLLAGARYADGVTVRHVGGPIPSTPHIEMTLECLAGSGISAGVAGEASWRVEPGPVAGFDVTIEPDLSNAGPFAAAALVAGGRVTIEGWPQRTTQAGDGLRDLFDQMGAEVDLGPQGLTVTGTGEIYGLDADLSTCGELTPVVAALAALADSPSRLRGIGHLRGHETDRLAALTTELSRLGAQVEQLPDGLEIRPKPLQGNVFHTYHDHRLAQAGALLGLAVPGLSVENVATTAKTLPGFVGMWRSLVDGDPEVRQAPVSDDEVHAR